MPAVDPLRNRRHLLKSSTNRFSASSLLLSLLLPPGRTRVGRSPGVCKKAIVTQETLLSDRWVGSKKRNDAAFPVRRLAAIGALLTLALVVVLVCCRQNLVPATNLPGAPDFIADPGNHQVRRERRKRRWPKTSAFIRGQLPSSICHLSSLAL